MSKGKEKTEWDPILYLKYKSERTQPSIDLVSKINISDPKNIIDIGCGPGNSTRILADRWPHSRITGLDKSKQMIEKAKMDYPGQEWVLSDLSSIDSAIKYDIVFSNAAIQWIPDHTGLIPVLFNVVANNGALAVQIPGFRDMPLGKSINYVAEKKEWREYTNGCSDLFTYHDYIFYYDILSKYTSEIEIWETSYIHTLDSHESVLEWIKGTGLKPYIDRFDSPELKNDFENDILDEIKKHYPRMNNGKVLFPFKRLFFIAYK